MAFKYRQEEQMLGRFSQEEIDEMHRRDDNSWYYEHPEDIGRGDENEHPEIPKVCQICGEFDNFEKCSKTCDKFFEG